MSYSGSQVRVTEDAIAHIARLIDQAEGELRAQMATHVGRMMSWQSQWVGHGGSAARVALESYQMKSQKLFMLMQEFVSRLRTGNTYLAESDIHTGQEFKNIDNATQSLRMEAILG